MSEFSNYPHESDVRHTLTSHGVESGFVPTPIIQSILVAEIISNSPILPRIKTVPVTVIDRKIIFPNTNVIKILNFGNPYYRILNFEYDNGVVELDRTPSSLDYYQKPVESFNVTYVYGFINGNVRPVVYDLIFNIAMSYDLHRVKFENDKYTRLIKPLCEDLHNVETAIQESRRHV